MRQLASLAALAFAAIAALPFSAIAQTDARPLKIIVPYPAGGQTDAMARILADSMRKTLHRPVVVDNKPGAGGLIGLHALQAAPADGDTVLMRDLALVIAPMLQKTATYNPNTDIVPVATVGRSDLFLMVPKDVPAKTVPELIAYAKTLPGGISAGNNGINTGAHIAAALFGKRTGVNVVHVPYKGSADATMALITGDSKFQFNTTTDALASHIKDGSVRIIATAAPVVSTFAPGAPPVSQFIPGAWPFEGYFSVFAVPGVAPEKLGAITKALELAVAEPGTRERFAALNVQTLYKPPAEVAKDIVRYQSMYRDLIKELGLEPQ
ncbi:MAG TPA: tripartite tricarboxylate transporter substrate binding protein [Ramlibacter sp.]|uniref:Bug family tripartite tricarboxylate transporter substrate binding protein n=1 Tax=Ramlibacter sp. TaxID=1917967 RepID=UPI002D128EFF|nr:tripartite tricarboxylate transporter substrate binding protein [Ramlibacter sp.]HVZ45201.1 tripartite tricarboxylate transporter substrate binding protein [Ramlibacter sp.]